MTEQKKTIRQLREDADLSQAALAAKVGVSVATYYLWEKGAHAMRVPQFAKLCRVLGVKMDDVSIGEDTAPEDVSVVIPEDGEIIGYRPIIKVSLTERKLGPNEYNVGWGSIFTFPDGLPEGLVAVLHEAFRVAKSARSQYRSRVKAEEAIRATLAGYTATNQQEEGFLSSWEMTLIEILGKHYKRRDYPQFPVLEGEDSEREWARIAADLPKLETK